MRTQSKVNKGVIDKNDCLTTSERAKQYAKGPADALRGGAVYSDVRRQPMAASVRAAFAILSEGALSHTVCTTYPTKWKNRRKLAVCLYDYSYTRELIRSNSHCAKVLIRSDNPLKKMRKTQGKVRSPGGKRHLEQLLNSDNAVPLLPFP
jgi:hypothetical protein